MNKPVQGLFMITLEMAEQIYSVPVEEREALLLKMAKEHKAKFLGATDLTGPELATEFIKKGVKARSYCNNKKALTITPKSGKLLEKKRPPA